MSGRAEGCPVVPSPRRKELRMSESRKALHELIDLLREVDQRYLGPSGT